MFNIYYDLKHNKDFNCIVFQDDIMLLNQYFKNNLTIDFMLENMTFQN